MSFGISILALTKSTGGTAVYNQTLLSGLDPERFRTLTICLSENAEAYAAGLRGQRLDAEPFAMDRYSLDPAGDLRVIRRIANIVREQQVDVILAHGSKAGFMGRAVGRMTSTPTIYCQASLPFLRRIQGWKAVPYTALELVARGFGGHIVCLTESARLATRRFQLVSEESATVIRTGIDVSQFRPRLGRDAAIRALALDPGRRVVGWMGRLEPQKAPLDYVDALERMVRCHPDVQFVIAGEGRQSEAVDARLAATGLDHRVHRMPWQSDPVAVYEAFDVLVMSSRWEGLPLSLLEAMAMETVPISTDVDGCGEVIRDGVDGRLVPAANPKAMADALNDVLVQSDLSGMKTQARRRIETEFNKSQMISQWETLIRAMVAGPAVGEVVQEGGR